MAGRGIFNRSEGLVAIKTPNQGVANYEGQTLLSTSIDILDGGLNAIGFINQINSSKSRPTTRIRHISSKDAGRVLEQAPGNEDITLTLGGFALYNDVDQKGSLAQRLGGWNPLLALESLTEQHVGFSLIRTDVHPKDRVIVNAKEWYDCWYQSESDPVVMGTATVLQQVTIFPSGVRKLDELIGQVV